MDVSINSEDQSVQVQTTGVNLIGFSVEKTGLANFTSTNVRVEHGGAMMHTSADVTEGGNSAELCATDAIETKWQEHQESIISSSVESNGETHISELNNIMTFEHNRAISSLVVVGSEHKIAVDFSPSKLESFMETQHYKLSSSFPVVDAEHGIHNNSEKESEATTMKFENGAATVAIGPIAVGYQGNVSVISESVRTTKKVVEYQERSTTETEIEVVDCTSINEEENEVCENLALNMESSTGGLSSHDHSSHVHESADGFVRKTFTSDLSWEEEDGQLREHWTRTLQSSTSTGEVVEEIVRVLKQQKTHDLLCPLCGSCITKRVVLRKRKRASSISVDPWYVHTTENVSSVSLPEVVQEEEDERDTSLLLQRDGEDTETEAYGCLACFSLFFKKVTGKLESTTEQTQEDDVERERFRCLPFFFPPYPWGLSSSKKDIPETTDILGVRVEETAIEINEDGDSLFQQQIDPTCGLAPVLLPDYPWGTCSKLEVKEDSALQPVAEVQQTSSLMQLPSEIDVEKEEEIYATTDGKSICGLVSAVFPQYPWGKGSSVTVGENDKQDYAIKETHDTEKTTVAHITTETNVITVTSVTIDSYMEKASEKPIEPIKVDQCVTDLEVSLQLKGSRAEDKTPAMAWETLPTDKEPPLSRPSTVYALLEESNAMSPCPAGEEKSVLDEIQMEPTPSTEEFPSEQENIKSNGVEVKPVKAKQESIGTQFWAFSWFTSKVSNSDKLMEPLLEKTQEHAKAPSRLSFKWLPTTSKSKLKVEQQSILPPALPSLPEVIEKIPEGSPVFYQPLAAEQVNRESVIQIDHGDAVQPVKQVVAAEQVNKESVIQIDHGDAAQPVEQVVAVAPVNDTPEIVTHQESEGWEILRSIVHGGLDVSIASLGVVSSAAGGEATTRTVVYMAVATLLSGLIAFYHNVVNVFRNQRANYIQTVGKTLWLHGTVAIISYFLFGILAPITYAFTFRDSDNIDRKFAATCGVSLVSIILLSLGKARVSNRPYKQTVFLYISSGVVSSVVGYFAGEHIAKLLEKWGFKDNKSSKDG